MEKFWGFCLPWAEQLDQVFDSDTDVSSHKASLQTAVVLIYGIQLTEFMGWSG